jgi:3'-5' exonuclease
MNRVVFDIETLALPFDMFDSTQQEYLMKFAETPEEQEEAVQRLALTPLTAQVIAIGMLNPDSNHGRVLYQGPGDHQRVSDDGSMEFVPLSEHEILEEFWQSMAHYSQVITFNGRSFDGPFIMLRSSLLGVRSTRNLVPYRYSAKEHCDLLDQFTFYGISRKFNLDFYCKAFGIVSPKAEGITGRDLGDLFREKRYSDIADYCLADVRATAELFRRWQAYLSFDQ